MIRRNSLEEPVSTPFPENDSSRKRSYACHPSMNERRGWQLCLESVDSESEVEDMSHSLTTKRTTINRSEGVALRESRNICQSIDRLGKLSTEGLNQCNCNHESNTTTEHVVNDEERLRLGNVQRRRVQLAKIIPSLAKEIKNEGLTGQVGKSSCQIQAGIISHLKGFIEQTVLPVILGLPDLQKEYYMQSMKSQWQIEFLRRQNSLLKAEIEDAGKENREVEKKRLKLLNSQSQLVMGDNGRRSGLDWNEIRSKPGQQNVIATVEKQLLTSQNKHDTDKEQLMDVLRTFYERMNQLELESYNRASKKRSGEEEIIKAREQLAQITKDVISKRLESGALESQRCTEVALVKDKQRSPAKVSVPKQKGYFLHRTPKNHIQIRKVITKRSARVNHKNRVSRSVRKAMNGAGRISLGVSRGHGSCVQKSSGGMSNVSRQKHQLHTPKERGLGKFVIGLSSIGGVPTLTNSRYQESVGELVKAYNRKPSKLEKEQRRALFHKVGRARKVPRQALLSNYPESGRGLNRRRTGVIAISQWL